MFLDETVVGLAKFLKLSTEGEARRTVIDHVFHISDHVP